VYPFSSPDAGRSGRPSRFTIRELLVLVAMANEGERPAYVHHAYVWFHERTRVSLAAILLMVGSLLTLVAQLPQNPIRDVRHG